MKIRGMLQKALFLCLLAVCMTFSGVLAMASESTETTTETTTEITTDASQTTVEIVKEGSYYCCYKNGELVKNEWVEYQGAKYYFNAKGRAVTNSKKISGKVYVFSLKGKLLCPSKAKIMTVGKYSYYVSTEGVASTGWFTVNGKLYYANSKGRLYKNKTKDGIKFSKSGAAKSSTYSELKILTMKIVSEITTSSMTKKQKLKACWNYVINNTKYKTKNPDGKKGWPQRLALSCLKYKRGSCSGFACAFAALAKEIGYKNIYIIRGTIPGNGGMPSHTWVKINGLYYDPEAHYAGWMKNVFGYSIYPIKHTISSKTRYAN